MAVWTNGTRDIAIRRNGLAVYTKNVLSEFLPIPALEKDDAPFPRRYPDPEFLAVSDAASIAVVGRQGGRFTVVSLKASFPMFELAESGALDVVSLGQDEFLYAVSVREDSAHKPDSRRTELKRIRISSTGEIEHFAAPRIPEPKNVKTADTTLEEYEFSDVESFGYYGFRLTATEYGVVASDDWHGLLAYMPAGSEDFSFCLRFPSHDLDQVYLAGLVLRDHLIVSYGPYRDYPYLLQFSKSGEMIALEGGFSCSSSFRGEEVEWNSFLCPTYLESNEFLVGNCAGERWLHFSSSRNGLSERVIDIAPANAQYVAAASDRVVIATENGSAVYFFKRTRGKSERNGDGISYDLKELPPLNKKQLERIHAVKSAPEFTIALATSKERAIVARTSEELSLPFTIVNRGGQGDSLVVVVDGDAVSNGLLSPLFAEVDGAEIEMIPESVGLYRGKLRNFELEPALHEPGAALVESRLTLKLKLEAYQPGKGRLRLRLAVRDQQKAKQLCACNTVITVRA